MWISILTSLKSNKNLNQGSSDNRSDRSYFFLPLNNFSQAAWFSHNLLISYSRFDQTLNESSLKVTHLRRIFSDDSFFWISMKSKIIFGNPSLLIWKILNYLWFFSKPDDDQLITKIIRARYGSYLLWAFSTVRGGLARGPSGDRSWEPLS